MSSTENGNVPEEDSPQRTFSTTDKIIGASLYLGGIAFLAVTGGLCISGTLNLAGETTSLVGFGERAEFTFKYLFMGVFWLLFLIFLVIFWRGKTGALNPLGGKEIHIQKQANILQNSFEQFVISAFAQLTLVAYLDEKYTLRTIPWVNFSFLIGRIAYLFGYPNRRGFGFLLSVIPSVGMIGVVIYKFFVHLF